MLQLPDIEPTRTTVPSAPTGPEATADAPQAPAVVPVSLPARPRRRSLLAAGGALALLAGGGGTAAWLLRDKEKESTPDKKGPGPVRPILAIGLQADLSGPGQAVGKAQRDGALLAVEELTSRDDLPFAFRLAESDDRGAAPPARPASPLPWPRSATGAGPSPPRPSTTPSSSRKRAGAPRAGCWSPPRSTRPRPPRPAPSTRPSAPVTGPPPRPTRPRPTTPSTSWPGARRAWAAPRSAAATSSPPCGGPGTRASPRPTPSSRPTAPTRATASSSTRSPRAASVSSATAPPRGRSDPGR